MKRKKRSEPKTRVVIVGAGFGGMAVYRKIKDNRELEITIINDESSFRYSPALYRAASGYRRRQAIIPLKELIASNSNTQFIQAKVLAINKQKQVITMTDGKKISYDYAVLALGVVTNYFGIPGLEKFSFGIKTASTLDHFHAHLHSDLAHNHKPDRNYVIVGAGPTGTELSAGLTTYLKKIIKKHGLANKTLKIEVIERADRVLPTMSPKVSELVTKRLRKMGVRILLGEAVVSETDTTLKLADRSILTRTVVWTAGTSNNPFFKSNAGQFEISERGKVIVNDYFEVDKHLHVIGDNIEGRFSGLAQSAVKHGHFVGKLINKKISHKTTGPYKPTQPTYVVPIGKNWAVMERDGRVFSGWWVSVVRAMADLMGYRDILGTKKAIKIWLASDIAEETCKICRQPSHMDLNKIESD